MTSRFKITYSHCTLPFVLASLFFLTGCEPSPPPKSQNENNAAEEIKVISPIKNSISEAQAKQLSGDFWQQGFNRLTTVKTEAEQLEEKISELLNEPNETTLLAAYAQWESTFLSYQQLAPLTFIEHPLLSRPLSQWRFTIAAWPLQPGNLDSYGPYIQSGLANDITLPVTVNVLRQQHGRTDSEEVILGLYAIEFLLKGDNSKAPSKRFLKQDKVPLAFAQAGLKLIELPNNRRRQLLILQSDLLVQDLNAFIQQWQANAQLNILFSQLSPLERLQAYHNGLMTALAELHTLSSYEVEVNEGEAEAKEAYHNRFYQQRKQVISKQLSVIESLYEKEASDIQGEKLLLIDTLTETEQKKLKEKIETLNEALKKQLTE